MLLVWKNTFVFTVKNLNLNSVGYILLGALLIFYDFMFSLGKDAGSFKQPPSDLAKMKNSIVRIKDGVSGASHPHLRIRHK